MQHYFFHVRDRWGEALDEEGMELRDLAAARRVAVNGARSLICADVASGILDLSGCVEVRDSSGACLLSLSFAEAVDVAAPPRR